MLDDPLADLGPEEFSRRVRVEALLNAGDIAVVTLGCLALMAGLHWPTVVLAGLHLVAGMLTSANKLLWGAIEAVVLLVGTVAIGWASRGLSTIGIDFLPGFFAGAPLLVQAAAASLVMALFSQASGAMGVYHTVAEFEIGRRYSK